MDSRLGDRLLMQHPVSWSSIPRRSLLLLLLLLLLLHAITIKDIGIDNGT